MGGPFVKSCRDGTGAGDPTSGIVGDGGYVSGTDGVGGGSAMRRRVGVEPVPAALERNVVVVPAKGGEIVDIRAQQAPWSGD